MANTRVVYVGVCRWFRAPAATITLFWRLTSCDIPLAAGCCCFFLLLFFPLSADGWLPLSVDVWCRSIVFIFAPEIGGFLFSVLMYNKNLKSTGEIAIYDITSGFEDQSKHKDRKWLLKSVLLWTILWNLCCCCFNQAKLQAVITSDFYSRLLNVILPLK